MLLDSPETAQKTTKVSMSLFDFQTSLLHTSIVRSNARSLTIRLVLRRSCKGCN